MKPRFLFLFADDWDEAAIRGPLTARFEVVREGFDLFRFPGNASILWFDARRWVDRLARRYRNAGVAGVASTNEQYGALVAAELAQRLGVPGTDPVAIIRAQHKYYARCALAGALPAVNPRFAVLPRDAREPMPLAFPFFVKPVKAAYSVLARRVDNAVELARHLTFGPLETHVIKRLVRPFADLMREHAQFTVDPLAMLGEGLLDGIQFNVDGWMDRGQVGFFGIVDSVMYPGTQAFARFEHPSRLPRSVQADAYAVAERAMRAIGFAHGAFNVELTWEPAEGRIRVIEINPRLAAQFADLYQKVHGASPYAVLADLSSGRAPQWTQGQGRYAAAASFVLRAFDDAARVAPGARQRRWLAEHHPDAALLTFIKRGISRRCEMKWLGSYRYAIVSLGGTSREDLERRFADVCRHVHFERAIDVGAEPARAT